PDGPRGDLDQRRRGRRGTRGDGARGRARVQRDRAARHAARARVLPPGRHPALRRPPPGREVMARLAGPLTIAAVLVVLLPGSGSATGTRGSELSIGPIRARFLERFRETTYSVPKVHETANGATIFYEWSLTLQKVDPNQGLDLPCNNHGVFGGI